MTSKSDCPGCGAPSSGLVCQFCGVPLAALTDLETEAEALNQFYLAVSAKDSAGQVSLLRGGFLPDHVPVLIEAGLRCVPFLSTELGSAEAGQAALSRLKAVVHKLKLQPPTEEIEKAIGQLEAAAVRHQKDDTRNAVLGFSLIGGVALVVGLLLVLILYMVCR